MIAKYGESQDDLYISMEVSRKIYLFYDTVHLVKNIRNNLLARKRFIFPPFSFSGFPQRIEVPGGEISWKILHDLHEKDKECTSNLRKAPKLNSQVRISVFS